MIYFFLNFFVFYIFLFISIIVHELGHFLIANFLNLKINIFSVGFGYSIFKWKDRFNTKYYISIIPLYGYLKIDNLQFSNKPNYQKIILIISGSILNIIFAIIIYWFILINGIFLKKSIITHIIPDSIAYTLHFNSNIELKCINNIKIIDLNTVRLSFLKKNNLNIKFVKFNMKKIKQKKIILNNLNFKNNEDPIIKFGFIPNDLHTKIIIKNITPNLVSKYNFKIGDQIISINDHLIYTLHDFFKILKKTNFNQILKINIKRKSTNYNFIKTINIFFNFQNISKIQKKNFIYQEFLEITQLNTSISLKKNNMIRLNFINSFLSSINKVYYISYIMYTLYFKLFTQVNYLKYLNTYLINFNYSYICIKQQMFSYLIFLSLININLGIINLFPLPILDGGNILYLTIKKINNNIMHNLILNMSYYLKLIIIITLIFNNIFYILKDL